MQAPSGNKPVPGGLTSRLAELGIALPAPPTPLGAYVESSDAGNLLFLSGMLPVVNRKLVISGRLGEKLSVREGQQAARNRSRLCSDRQGFATGSMIRCLFQIADPRRNFFVTGLASISRNTA